MMHCYFDNLHETRHAPTCNTFFMRNEFNNTFLSHQQLTSNKRKIELVDVDNALSESNNVRRRLLTGYLLISEGITALNRAVFNKRAPLISDYFVSIRKGATKHPQENSAAMDVELTCNFCTIKSKNSSMTFARCNFCEKPNCNNCVRLCSNCNETFCKFCLTVQYKNCFEEVVCIDCNRNS